MGASNPAEHGFRVLAAVLRWQRPLIGYAAGLLGDPERARDVVQETFLRACGEEEAFAQDRVAPWLFRVARNLAIDELRRQRRMAPFDPGADDSEAETRLAADPTVPDVVELRTDATTVLRVIETLPPKQRDVLRLKFLGELSYREVAELTEQTESYVGYLLHVGIRVVRERLAGAERGRREVKRS